MMQPAAQALKLRGRLSRQVQSKLGQTLHAMYDEIVKEGVPDRFAKLLEKIEAGQQPGAPAAARGEQSSKTAAPDTTGITPGPSVTAGGPSQPLPESEDEGSR